MKTVLTKELLKKDLAKQNRTLTVLLAFAGLFCENVYLFGLYAKTDGAVLFRGFGLRADYRAYCFALLSVM